jgi:PIN domain nuclease of toxin-antitoxin system
VSRFLVDTQLLLWNAWGSDKLPARVWRLFRDGRHEFFASAASLWEVAIKSGRSRKGFRSSAATLRENVIANGFHELPVTGAHAAAIDRLPLVHGDPFDRLIVAQALVEPMILLTTDARLAAYPGTIEVVE